MKFEEARHGIKASTVIVILRYIYNLARKWKTPGGAENPAAGLSAGRTCSAIVFSAKKRQKLSCVRSMLTKPDCRACNHASAADGRPSQRNHFL